jgi:cellulose synthase/poly-beta-1,6-N-acetylglucosamine synthase-like glycosyltransferase
VAGRVPTGVPEPTGGRWARYFGPFAFVTGILSIPMSLLYPLAILGVVAIFAGAIGRKNAQLGAPYEGLATWGFWLGWITIFLYVMGEAGKGL